MSQTANHRLHIIRSHKTLFVKILCFGLILTALSIYILVISGQSIKQKSNEAVKAETLTYFASIESMADIIVNDEMRDIATLFVKELTALQNPSKAIADVAHEFTQKGYKGLTILFQDFQGTTYSTPIDSDTAQLIDKCNTLRLTGASKGNIVYKNQFSTLAFIPITIDFVPSTMTNGRLTVVFPTDILYSQIDHQNRIIRLELSSINRGASKIIYNDLSVTIPLKTYDGNNAAMISIKSRPSLVINRDAWGWKTITLSILPLLAFLLFSYLVYRYLESFANQLGSLRRILRPGRPGVEFFRRDDHIKADNMPELAEIFELVDQNFNENTSYKRSLDILAIALRQIGEKGFDQLAINNIIEVIAAGADSNGGGIFALGDNDDSVGMYGKYNLNEDQLHILCQTPSGSGLLKLIQKQAIPLQSIHIQERPQDDLWRRVFENYQYVLAMPLGFRSDIIGILFLASNKTNPLEQMSNRYAEILSELLAAMVYGIRMEREKESRLNTTRLLQETSQAVSSTLDLPSVLKVVAGRLSEYIGATYCLILLNTENKNVMEVASFFSRRRDKYNTSDLRHINLVEFPKLSGLIAGQKASILGMQELAEFTQQEKHFFGVENIRRLTVLPISHSANPIGVVVLGEERSKDRSPVSQDRLNFIQAMAAQAASAIENARLYSYINHKLSELTTLYNVSAIIHADIDISSMLEKVLTACEDYLLFSAAAIFSSGDKSGQLKTLIVKGRQNMAIASDVIDISAESVAGLVASEGNSVLIDDIRLEPDIQATFNDTLSELAVPIKIGNEIIGVFCIASARKHTFTQIEESFLQALAAQIAVAMERARLFDHERNQQLKLGTIFEFSKELSQSINLHEVMEIGTRSIREAFDYQLVAIFLIDQANQRFYVGAQSTQTDKELPKGFTVPFGEGLVGRAVDTRKYCYCPDVYNDPAYVAAIDDVKSEICIPIIVADKLLAILDVESMRLDDFDTEDISTLEALSDIMAVALDNSYLFEETTEKAERLALIDNINKTISSTLDLDSFFKVVAKAVADNAGYRWTSLVVLENNSFIFKAGYTSKSAGVILPEPLLQMLDSKLRLVIENARPEFISFSQLASQGEKERLQQIVDAGIRNLALFPIGDSLRADAVMIVGSAQSEGFSSQELALLRDLAVHLRIAWQNAKLYKQLKTAYEQLQEAQDRIVQTEKLRALGEMSSGVVHDFNNILAAILGRTQILQHKLGALGENPEHDFLEKNLDIIEKAASDGSHILSRISEFTKTKPTEKFVAVQIDQIIADAIELTRPRWRYQARSNGRHIEIEYHRGEIAEIMGSPSELREVFTNLIINAVDAISGDGKINIKAHLEPAGVIKIIVSDNGHGMSEETRKRIFEPFFTTKGERGTGLGLSVTYGIISRHKGMIKVESELGRGTEFIITLPLTEPDKISENPVAIEKSRPKQARILVVDDEQGFREILAEILASGGHYVDAAPDEVSALQMLNRKNYDMVITDLGMPNISGWELADAIYASHPDVKVVMDTGWGAHLEPGKLSLHHVNSLISKPFKIDEILAVVEKVMICKRDEVWIEKI
jgi:signal transduction histidine kinase/putative methionine-R-sulfoxide reductase with GAF domain/ActR/RegA family two-component response regulator